MTTFKDREKALENRYFAQEEQHFRIISRRRKLLGLWAAEQLHLTDEDSLAYALEIVRFGVEDNSEGAVVKRIQEDLSAAGITITEAEVREKMATLHKESEKQLAAE